MWKTLLDKHLQRLMRVGTLVLTYADGTTYRYGTGREPTVAVTLSDPAFPRKFILSPELTVGEAYMDGTLTIADDDVYGFLELAVMNRAEAGNVEVMRLLNALRVFVGRMKQFNPMGRSKANVAHHYDLSAKLYDLFLDSDRQYSCGYFKRPDDTLEQAQIQKKHHIAKKLLISPGMRVLDIGCGWGGMALTLARDYGAQVVGVTLSEEQLKLGRKRVEEAGLTDRIDLRLQDYRAVTESFDRVVSVGMFEHVGVPQYRTYFRKVRELLAEDGIALIHTIGNTAPPGATSAWIEKYIFPGGYCPSMSEAMAAVEKEDLYPTDVEVWRLHYAETIRHWTRRFEANVDIARDLFDDRFCRMWRYYLAACEVTFRHDHQAVFQFQLARRQDAVPLTRDYLYQPVEVEAEEVPQNRPKKGLIHAAE